jgi:hypothetical protein
MKIFRQTYDDRETGRQTDMGSRSPTKAATKELNPELQQLLLLLCNYGMKVTSLGHIIDVTHDGSVQIVVVVNSTIHTAQTYKCSRKKLNFILIISMHTLKGLDLDLTVDLFHCYTCFFRL